MVERHHQARPRVGDVGTGAPEVTDVAGPGPRLVPSPFADREDHRAPRSPHCVAPDAIRRGPIEAPRVTPIDLHEVDAPLGEPLRVAHLVAAARRITLAGARASARVQAEAQAAPVDLVAEPAQPVREGPAVLDEVAV